MNTIVFLLEEPSTKILLETIIPKLNAQSEFQYHYIVFSGKSDLEKKVEQRVKFWNVPSSYFVIIRDKDSADCISVKKNLQSKCEKAGKIDKSLIRIACHGLESFYLGDLKAVSKAFNKHSIEHLESKAKYRNPDFITNPKEELKKITSKEYQPIEGSRKIAQYLKLDGTNKSKSFNVLIDGIRKILTQ